MTDRIVPNRVRDLALQHGVDPRQVKPSASHVTFWDLYEYADAHGADDLAVAAVQASTAELRAYAGESSPSTSYRPPGRPMGTVSRYEVNRMPVNAMARNPLVDRVRAAASAKGVPAPSGNVPGLFATGDTPAFCASGIPPEAVLTVPWQARHAMAAAPTAADAYEIQNECTGPDAERTAQILFGNHPGNEDYQYRVDQWRVQSMTDEQLQYAGEPGTREEIARRERERTDAFNRSRVEERTAPEGRSGAPSEEDAVIDSFAARGANVVLSNGRDPGQWSSPGQGQ